jgi:predicted NBD/HSP70 family sugar kinase
MRIDKNFVPIIGELIAYENKCKTEESRPFAFWIERNDGFRQTWRIKLLKDDKYNAINYRLVERLIKTSLYVYGGYRIYVGGCGYIAGRLIEEYRPGGKRDFDVKLMTRVYEKPFEIIHVTYGEVPDTYEKAEKHTFSLKGCRIGFDAGGSDRKVSAVIDGNAVFSEEVVWHPKTAADPDYHYAEIIQAFKSAAARMPRVDAIGISSAGIYINNQVKAASLFIKVPDDLFDKKVKNIYINAARELFGDIPVVVANDGDVTALAGAMSLNTYKVLGIAMGTSEAAGYVDGDGCIKGWLNELAFAPVDYSQDAAIDPWSGDIGCGVNYFSQDAVIKLAQMCNLELKGDTPAEKLKSAQTLLRDGEIKAQWIFEDIGEYLAHSLAYYLRFYDTEQVLILGRVTSGRGGELILNTCNAVLKASYPHIAEKVKVNLPDEKSRRVGQSIAAASLPLLD